MRIVLHQPYFLPWLGYFSKLFYADIFVVLDDVNFRKRHFYDRTKIIDMHGQVNWMGLPVGENHLKKCFEVYLKDTNCLDTITKTIKFSYAKALHYDEEINWILEILASSISTKKNIVIINIEIIYQIITHLGIKKTKMIYSSEFNKSDDATQRIIDICKFTKASSILIGGGSSTKVHNIDLINNNGIDIYQQDYLKYHPTYSQSRKRKIDFISGLSIIDTIFNVGRTKTREFLVDKKFEPIKINSKSKNGTFDKRD